MKLRPMTVVLWRGMKERMPSEDTSIVGRWLGATIFGRNSRHAGITIQGGFILYRLYRRVTHDDIASV